MPRWFGTLDERGMLTSRRHSAIQSTNKI
jgi:hypothetical protein